MRAAFREEAGAHNAFANLRACTLYTESGSCVESRGEMRNVKRGEKGLGQERRIRGG